MSSREETKEDSSREESYELVTETVTPHDQESRRTIADRGESDEGTPSVEELRERAERIRQGLDQGSQDKSSRPVARRELQFESGDQVLQESDESDNQSQ